MFYYIDKSRGYSNYSVYTPVLKHRRPIEWIFSLSTSFDNASYYTLVLFFNEILIFFALALHFAKLFVLSIGNKPAILKPISIFLLCQLFVAGDCLESNDEFIIGDYIGNYIGDYISSILHVNSFWQGSLYNIFNRFENRYIQRLQQKGWMRRQEANMYSGPFHHYFYFIVWISCIVVKN